MTGCLIFSWNWWHWRVRFVYFGPKVWAVAFGPVGLMWHRGTTYTEVYGLWVEMGRREQADKSAHAPELSDSEPQESEQAETTKQKEKAGEDV
jgi:hypothetical protein